VADGILLCANLDALFDKHLISFSDDGKLLISHRLPVGERSLLAISEETSIHLVDAQRAYLKHHRSIYEKKNALGLAGQ
jgi:predicted restriction endonuclease